MAQLEHIEFEALYPNVDIAALKQKLQSLGGVCSVPRRLMRRQVLELSEERAHKEPYMWVRIRDEGDKITASVKGHDGTDAITAQTEITLVVDSYERAVEFMLELGCIAKSYQENYRETWMLDGAEVVIDEWPYLDPYIEIEAASEEKVKEVSQRLGFDYATAIFSNVIELYHRTYGWEHRAISTYPKIVFDQPNPFVVT